MVTDQIRHSATCARLAPLLDAIHTTDAGRRVAYRRCSACAGTDLDSTLVDELLPDHDDGSDAA